MMVYTITRSYTQLSALLPGKHAAAVATVFCVYGGCWGTIHWAAVDHGWHLQPIQSREKGPIDQRGKGVSAGCPRACHQRRGSSGRPRCGME